MWLKVYINTLRLRQNCGHFTNNVFKSIFLNENVWISHKIPMFLRFELTIFQHWFRWWLGTNKATSHYLNQWWLDCRCIYASLSLHELIFVWTLQKSILIHQHWIHCLLHFQNPICTKSYEFMEFRPLLSIDLQRILLIMTLTMWYNLTLAIRYNLTLGTINNLTLDTISW